MIVRGISLPYGDTHFSAHLDAGPEFAGKGTYQFAKIERALEACPARGIALDVGGHVGLWSRVLAHHFTRVVAFEPCPALAPHFAANVADCENVELMAVAVGDEVGELRLQSIAENSGNGHVLADGVGAASEYTAQAVTIDSLNMHGVDLIKIDVEGWELQVVRGAARTIKRDWPVMVVEQKPGNAERYGTGRYAAVELLKSWGYEVVWLKSGDFCLRVRA